MTNEQIEVFLKQVVTREELHKELHAQTRQFVTWMGLATAIILGGVYFLLSDVKNDLREIRTRIAALPK
jgi:hypothetical protein